VAWMPSWVGGCWRSSVRSWSRGTGISAGNWRDDFPAETAARQEELRTPLRWGEEHGSPRTRTLCRNVLDRWISPWAWLEVAGGEPTNNAAEVRRESRVSDCCAGFVLT
jgi:hypothetical protein